MRHAAKIFSPAQHSPMVRLPSLSRPRSFPATSTTPATCSVSVRIAVGNTPQLIDRYCCTEPSAAGGIGGHRRAQETNAGCVLDECSERCAETILPVTISSGLQVCTAFKHVNMGIPCRSYAMLDAEQSCARCLKIPKAAQLFNESARQLSKSTLAVRHHNHDIRVHNF